jgi:hypothetical protein
LDSSEVLSKYSVAFFSETWLTSPKSLILDKDFFQVPAVRATRRGRPSGGLHLYCNPQLQPRLISSCFNYIAVQLATLSVVGVYFKPNSDLDDIITTLATALNNVNTSLPIILGGDLNLRPDTQDFREVQDFLSHYGMQLASDPSKPTFLYPRGKSCIDFVFASSTLTVLNCSTIDVACSDHLPLQLVLKLPRKQATFNVRTSPRRGLDLDACVDFLSNPELLQLPPHEVVHRIDEFFVSRDSTTPLKRKCAKPWFTRYSYSLRQECLRLLQLSRVNPAFSTQFCIARSAYHRHIRSAKLAYFRAKADDLVVLARREGLPALYRKAKRNSPGSAIPLHDLFSYSKDLFSAAPGNNSITPMPGCEVENHPLLEAFTLSEISDCLSKAKSKAGSSYAHGSLSPFSLKLLSPTMIPILQRVFNHSLATSTFPSSWLESTLFFLYKKGDHSVPSNYRTIAIENPFLKVFMLLVTKRMPFFAESEDLLPAFQFGFRPARSCLSAASLLHHIVSTRLSARKRTYAAFIDFSKAFDSVNRRILFTKLQLLGFPFRLCNLVSHIFINLEIRIKQNSLQSPPFVTEKGTPQGDPLSPLLFSLFLADLPLHLMEHGIAVTPTISINFLQYADDLVVLSENPTDLQHNLNVLFLYCESNHLTINIPKSKYLVFHKGRLPVSSVSINSVVLEKVSSFSYLGFHFSPQLSFSRHLAVCTSKANARIGLLFSCMPLKFLPIETVLNVFFCFIFPILTYGIHVWSTRLSQASMSALNALFTKFLKRYLCLPVFSNNAIIHFITDTRPLFETLILYAHSHPFPASFPPSLSGLPLACLSALPPLPHVEYSPLPLIPSPFWLTKVVAHIPLSPTARRLLLHPLVSPFFPDFAR